MKKLLPFAVLALISTGCDSTDENLTVSKFEGCPRVMKGGRVDLSFNKSGKIKATVQYNQAEVAWACKGVEGKCTETFVYHFQFHKGMGTCQSIVGPKTSLKKESITDLKSLVLEFDEDGKTRTVHGTLVRYSHGKAEGLAPRGYAEFDLNNPNVDLPVNYIKLLLSSEQEELAFNAQWLRRGLKPQLIDLQTPAARVEKSGIGR